MLKELLDMLRAKSPLNAMLDEFTQMMDKTEWMFDAATQVLMGKKSAKEVEKEIYTKDKEVNEHQRSIRRKIIRHLSLQPGADVPACLVLMSVAKDAERVGDYGKNLFDLAEITPGAPEGKHREALVELKDRISEMMANCREVFDSSEKEAAKRLIVEAKRAEDLCDEHVRNLVREGVPDPMAPAYVLGYRYFKRVAAHVRNIASSVVQPVHKLDFTSKITAEDTTEDTPEKAEGE